MNRAVLMLFLAAVGAAGVGCGTDPCQAPMNGDNGVLNFQMAGRPAQGLMTQVNMLRGPAFWDTRPALLSRMGDTCFAFDDAEVEVTLPEAFGGEQVTLVRPSEEPVQIEFKCSAPAGEPQTIAVKVTKDGKVRYQDTFGITCQALESASPMGASLADYTGRSLTGNGYAVGGLVHVNLGLHGAKRELFGFGATPVDELLAPTGAHDRALQDAFRAVAAGQSPVLQIGPLRAAVPIVLVDPSEWTVAAEANPGPPGQVAFEAWPVKADGTKLDGLEECRWEIFSATQSQVLEDTLCRTFQPPEFPGTGEPVTKMCVTGLDQSACVDVPRQ
ncbi:MAG TPA: hypothetical protein VFA20_18395 [Myxococcaceae bacterium]|nr:hypothetical protein [Myxococcaceae bacterium]